MLLLDVVMWASYLDLLGASALGRRALELQEAACKKSERARLDCGVRLRVLHFVGSNRVLYSVVDIDLNVVDRLSSWYTLQAFGHQVMRVWLLSPFMQSFLHLGGLPDDFGRLLLGVDSHLGVKALPLAG